MDRKTMRKVNGLGPRLSRPKKPLKDQCPKCGVTKGRCINMGSGVKYYTRNYHRERYADEA